MRDMKWHIFESPEGTEPLCWDDKALEFDTEEAAERFLREAKKHETDDEFFLTATIRECILYYDTGYLNATDIHLISDEETGELALKG